jgi:ubiquinone/menaquinone biosynthesis C-methylase UbiE
MNKRNIILLAAMVLVFCSAVKTEFSYKTFGNVANYFESEQDMRTFFDFRKGDVIAEIGAGDGNNIKGFTRITDSLSIYVQDIDSVVLSEKNFNKIVNQCNKIKQPSTNKLQRCIGTYTESKLPENTFDKIILVSTFHEFSSMDEMMTDIHTKLKPGGQLYILETRCLSHKNLSLEETIEILKKNRFVLVKSDGKDINNSTGLYRTVFKKL